MARVFYDADADLGLLSGLTVSVYDYGSVGRAQALNLRDSGVRVVVCERPGTPKAERAEAEGFELVDAVEAAMRGDVLALLVADLAQAELFHKSIEPNLTPGKMLLYYHGFAIHYGLVRPPARVDVAMIAPNGPGDLVRKTYVEGQGVPCLVAVKQDATGQALERALAYAKGMGATRAGVLETSFREETETDLFGEQAVLCGGLTALLKAGFDTLVEAGYQPELAYYECVNELKLIVDLIYEGGLAGMRYSISNTAEYGDYTAGPKLVDENVKQRMREILADIQSGKFAKDWVLENEAGGASFLAMRRREAELRVEKVGAELRALAAEGVEAPSPTGGETR